jgi:acetyl-CoA/propionyl-CoA carboxylase biotin carboxyl carrier protein
VTEFVWGVDLVHAQLRIASGERLALRQEALRPRGHAMEVRVCAEDPARGFLPCTGRVRVLEIPAGPRIRVDTALDPGLDVTVHYDPLLAKVVAWGETRDESLARLARALAEFRIGGVTTNVPFLRRLLDHAPIREGRYHTGVLDAWTDGRASDPETILAGALGAALLGHGAPGGPPEPWTNGTPGARSFAAGASARTRGPEVARHASNGHVAPPDGRPAPSPWLEAARREGVRRGRA